MKHLRLTAIVLLVLSITPFAFAEFFKFQQLRLKDLDEMRTMVQAKIQESRQLANKSSEDEDADVQKAVEKLRSALRLVLSRPNPDNMVEKLISPVRKELRKYNAFEDTLASLISSALHSVEKGKAKTVYRTSDSFVVENFLTEFKPEAKTNKEIRAIYEEVYKANLTLPRRVIRERRKNMYGSFEPSVTAGKILGKKKD